MDSITPISDPGNAELFSLRSLFDCYPSADWERLYRHLHNDNGPLEYVMAFRDDAGRKTYVRAKKHSVEKAIPWSLTTTKKGAMNSKPMAFTPYSANADGRSRWSALDFDAHDGNRERAYRFAVRALPLLLNIEGAFVLVEESGSGGYHAYAMAVEFRPISEWHELMKGIATRIGANVRAGECEVFPSSPVNVAGSLTNALRAPGSWNPGSGMSSRIVWENIGPMLAALAAREEAAKASKEAGERKKKRKSFSLLGELTEETTGTASKFLYRGTDGHWREEYAISFPNTRHERLRALVGGIFHQVARAVAEANARAQFREKTAPTVANESDHIKEFYELWEDLHRRWLVSMNIEETAAWHDHVTENERDAFRIIRSFQVFAAHKGDRDFPIGRDNLGERLGIEPESVGGHRGILARFVRRKILGRTREYVPHKWSARYAWFPRDGQPEQPF